MSLPKNKHREEEYRKEPLWENIPAALKDINQWVCWIAVERNGKITKPPISPKTGRLIDTTPEHKVHTL